MNIHGLHHVTAVTSDVAANRAFYTEVLGLRLVKKSVNQDDVSAYHLFYADSLGTPGWDMTFFDWELIGPDRRGTDSIVKTMFRVNGRAALEFWLARFDQKGVQHDPIMQFAGRDILRLEDPEGQRLMLVDDGGTPFDGQPKQLPDVPPEYALHGFYGVMLSVPRLEMIEPILTGVLGWERLAEYPAVDNPAETVHVFGMEGGGPGREVYVIIQPQHQRAQLGRGGTHHVAFRVHDEAEQQAWNEKLTQAGLSTSGMVDRFYFKSLYFRITPGILFELATDGPGFASDEPLETMGETLALPPFLEPHRARIEAGLKPL